MITESFFQAFLYRFLSTVFYQMLAYFPFRHHLRFRIGWVILSAGSMQIMLSAVYAFATMHGAPVTATSLISLVVSFLIFLLNIKAERGKILFLYVFMLDYVLLIQGLAYFTESLLFYSPGMTFGSVHTLMLILIYLAVTAPGLLFFLERTGSWALETNAPLFWDIAWLLPAFTTLIVAMYTSEGTLVQIRDIRFPVARILMILILFLVYYVLLRTLHLQQQERELEEQSARQASLLAIQNTQMQQMARHVKDVRQARHDLAQHLRVIQQYLNTGSREALQNYLHNYEQMLPKDNGRIYCENSAVNTIFSYYAEEARKAGLAFYTDLHLDEDLPVPEPALCAMLGNLLENALAAAQEAEEDEPYIRVRGKLSEHHLLFVIENSASSPPHEENGQFLSSKHEGFGTGTTSVRTIAEKYHGYVEFRYDFPVFSASVFLDP